MDSAPTVTTVPFTLPSLRTSRILCGALVTFLAGGACDGTDPAPQPANVTAHAGASQTAPVNTAVPVPPAVKVTDASGNGVKGVTVTFAVVSGGGSVTGGTSVTDAQGIAAVVAWTLGTAAGGNHLTATVAGLPNVLFTATGRAGPVASVSKNGGDNQTTTAGSAVAVPPSVVLRDAFGNLVSGAAVTFTVASGGGTVIGANATSTGQGIATVGGWTLGSTPGTNSLTATAQGTGISGNPQTFTATGVAGGGFNIEIRYVVGGSGLASAADGQPPTAAQQAAFNNAVQRWGAIITADLIDAQIDQPAGICGVPDLPALNEIVDDLLIFVLLEQIDGPGNILGQAGPCLIRSTNGLPAMGVMRFDVADLQSLENQGLLSSVILHEMGHVLGINVFNWNQARLLVNPSRPPGSPGADTHFAGPNAIAAFDQIGGLGYGGGSKVPVENTGVAGSADAHWREAVFGRELMTSFVSPLDNPLSVVTVRSLEDLGYEVNPTRADPFAVSFALRMESSALPSVRLVDDVWNVPIAVIDPAGRTVRVIPR